MNDIERYQFDLNGYVLVKGIMDADLVRACREASDVVARHMAANIDAPPQFRSPFNLDYYFDEKFQCHAYRSESGGGLQYIIDDFLNADPAFDGLVNHEATMRYVRELCAGPHRIVSSELRYRHKSNTTPSHMGGPMDTRNKYEFAGRQLMDLDAQRPTYRHFNLSIVRIVYAIHDVPVENGPLCVVPGTHKANYFSPYDRMAPTDEPGMIPVPMSAGDAIFFSENIRHGGFPNLLDTPRRTLHLAIGPRWMASQSPIHWDGQVYVSAQAWNRYSEAQRAVMPRPPSDAELEADHLREGFKVLQAENARLKERIAELERSEGHDGSQETDRATGLVGRLRKALTG